ncbi:MAG: hypothetical protein U0271_41215 [Polyangiaceae bacterium]
MRALLGFAVLFVVGAAACGETDSEDTNASNADDPAVAACNDLCDAQRAGEGCTDEVVSNCKDLCGLIAGRTGECADRTVEAYQCEATMTWSCSPGSDLAVSTDSLCDAELDAKSAACHR